MRPLKATKRSYKEDAGNLEGIDLVTQRGSSCRGRLAFGSGDVT